MTVIDKLLDNPTIWALVERCGWFDPHWQFDRAVARLNSTPARFAARLLDCAKFENPAEVAIAGMLRHGYQPTDKSLAYVNALLNPQTTNPEVMEKMKALFPDMFERKEKTSEEILADRLIKCHRRRLEDAGIYSSEQLIASGLWERENAKE